MRALITGVSGFIGGHLFNSAPDHWEVWGIFLNSPQELEPTRSFRVDLRDLNALNAVMNGIKPDLVIHCAGYSRVAFCELAPTTAWELNTWATRQLADICWNRNIRLIYLSSDMVFDGSKGDYSEIDQPNPINFYGRTKLASEHRLMENIHQTAILRVNLTYGKPRAGGTSFSEEVINSLKLGNPYHLFSDQFRSFISVKNLCQCVWEIAETGWTGLMHLGGSQPTDRVTFAHKLVEKAGLNSNLLIASSIGASPEVTYPCKNTFNLTLASNILSTPLLNLDEGLDLEYSQ
jgi:dTDP-4-dehydrorhamnose reductase